LGGIFEPRVYRAAFVPALLVVVLTMFSLQGRPRPLAQGLAADVLFDGRVAAAGARAIAEAAPDRRAGTPGDRIAAARVAAAFRSGGFPYELQRFSHAGHRLVNVIGRRAGTSRRQIVVVADRDARAVPDAPGSAADTAALIELARVAQGRPTDKTLVLASLDGGTLGEVGARELLSELPSPDLVDGVIAISDLAAPTRRGPYIQAWSRDERRAGIGLQRTVAESIRRELSSNPGGAGLFGQVARLSFPVGIGAQAVLLDGGYDAVRIAGSGELPPGGSGPAGAIDEDRLGALGRATLRTLTALDRGPRPEHGPRSYVTVVSQVVPGWLLTLLGIAFLLPALVAAVDAFARARRQHVDVVPWLRWVAAWVAPFLAALAIAELLALVGATPSPPPAPVPPRLLPLDGPALGVLCGVLAAMALGFVVARSLAARPDPRLATPEPPGAAVALALVAEAGALLLWLTNPYAGLLTVPAAHLWLVVLLASAQPSRRVRGALLALGALPAVLVALYYWIALSMDPLHATWYLLMLVTGHSVGLLTALVGCVMLGSLCAAAELVYRTPAPQADPPVAGKTPLGPGFALRR
jgi:hypothetical protein